MREGTSYHDNQWETVRLGQTAIRDHCLINSRSAHNGYTRASTSRDQARKRDETRQLHPSIKYCAHNSRQLCQTVSDTPAAAINQATYQTLREKRGKRPCAQCQGSRRRTINESPKKRKSESSLGCVGRKKRNTWPPSQRKPKPYCCATVLRVLGAQRLRDKNTGTGVY